MSKPENKGRCINCGFLAKHPKNPGLYPAPSYYEIEYDARSSGNVDFYRVYLGEQIATDAVCFVDAADISSEAAEYSTLDAREQDVLKEIFERDRNCPSWYRYTPGLSPKEHLDNLNVEILEKSRREFEERLERDRKEFDLKLFEVSQSIQRDSRKIASRSFWFNLFFTLVIIALTALQIWIALRSRFPEAGSLQKWLRRFFLPWI